MGSIYKRGNKLWIKYYRDGVPMRESTGSDKETVAKNLLKLREGDVARGVPITPKVNRLRLDEAAEAVIRDYRINARKSLDDLTRRFDKHIKPFFGDRRLASITAGDVQAYVDHRQGEKAANATINRELAALGRAFSLAIKSGEVTARPHFDMLEEDNVRTGFFERDQFERVRAHLPEPVRPVVTFAYVTGWRVRSEILPMCWRQVDFEARTVRLDPGTTKNKKGRVFPFTAELAAILEAQRADTRAVEKEKGIVCPYVFHRNGKQIKYFRRTWKKACVAAGVPGNVPHDFRRTAVRNLVRAGVPEGVAMKLTGHLTRSVFERYNVVSEGDLVAAAARLEQSAQ